MVGLALVDPDNKPVKMIGFPLPCSKEYPEFLGAIQPVTNKVSFENSDEDPNLHRRGLELIGVATWLLCKEIQESGKDHTLTKKWISVAGDLWDWPVSDAREQRCFHATTEDFLECRELEGFRTINVDKNQSKNGSEERPNKSSVAAGSNRLKKIKKSPRVGRLPAHKRSQRTYFAISRSRRNN